MEHPPPLDLRGFHTFCVGGPSPGGMSPFISLCLYDDLPPQIPHCCYCDHVNFTRWDGGLPCIMGTSSGSRGGVSSAIQAGALAVVNKFRNGTCTHIDIQRHWVSIEVIVLHTHCRHGGVGRHYFGIQATVVLQVHTMSSLFRPLKRDSIHRLIFSFLLKRASPRYSSSVEGRKNIPNRHH